MTEKHTDIGIQSIPEDSEVNFEEDSNPRRVMSLGNEGAPAQHMDEIVEQSFHLRNKSMNDLKLYKSRYFLAETVERNRSGKIKGVNGYEVTEELGKGAFGIVYKVQKTINDTPISFAMKVFLENKTTQRKGLRRAPGGSEKAEGVSILKEIAIMKRLNHPNLVHLEEVIEEKQHPFSIFVIMELLEEGSIMSSTSNPDPTLSPIFRTRLTVNGVFGEAQASKRFRELISAMAYLHLNHIAHRDLKPDNILMHIDGTLKLADFGVSRYFGDDDENKVSGSGIVSDTQGTWPFWSPEMCDPDSGDHGYSAYAADVWAAGVCLWIFVFGSLPFWDPAVDTIFKKIYLDPLPVFPSRKSPEFEELMWKMLTRDPNNRPKFSDCENFKWIKDHSDGVRTSPTSLVEATEEEISNALTPGDVELISDNISKLLKNKLSQVQERINDRKSLRMTSPTGSRQQLYMEQSSGSFLMDTLPVGGSSTTDTARPEDALEEGSETDAQNFLNRDDDDTETRQANDATVSPPDITGEKNDKCCCLS